MSTPPDQAPTSPPGRQPDTTAAQPGTPGAIDKPHYIERPDPGEKPLGFARLLIILVSSHIGVRSRTNREEDFRRANGLHVVIAAFAYFALIVGALILLVNFITGL